MCRQFYQVTIRPELLREVVFKANKYPDVALPAARSLLLWMRRHGTAVRAALTSAWET